MSQLVSQREKEGALQRMGLVCGCQGTGFLPPVSRVGKDGYLYNYVSRCPAYDEYFRTHMLESKPDDQEGQCKAAVERHKELWLKSQNKKPTRHRSDL